MNFHVVKNDGKPSHKIFYRIFGEKDPNKVVHRVLFSMGLAGTSLHWEPQVVHFESLSGFQVCTYDNRGVGHSDIASGRWTTRRMAEDALSLLDHLQWRKNIHIVGLSLGGMITQELALLDLPRFASMSLLSSSSGGYHALAGYVTNLHKGVRIVASAVLHPDENERYKAGLLALYPQKYLDKEVYNEKLGGSEKNARALQRTLAKRAKQQEKEGAGGAPEFTGFVKQVGALLTHSLSEECIFRLKEHFGEAILVLCGDEDILLHHSNSEILAEALNAEFVLIPNAGHGANEQDAVTTNDSLFKNFMRGEKRQLLKASRI